MSLYRDHYGMLPRIPPSLMSVLSLQVLLSSSGPVIVSVPHSLVATGELGAEAACAIKPEQSESYATPGRGGFVVARLSGNLLKGTKRLRGATSFFVDQQNCVVS